jgi:radical SAM superfamily enzyme YgiQ (UPF0313 family)
MPPAVAPHILLVNPWIDDFAAYDVWARPLGLLRLGALLRDHGCRVTLVDCLDRFHPRAPGGNPGARNGRGPFSKTRLPKPPGLADVPRHFSRYGIPEEWLREDLRRLPRPHLVLATSGMTYWYPGLQATLAQVREAFPGVRILLGGPYATLWPEHAKDVSGAHRVLTGAADTRILDLVAEETGWRASARYPLEDLDARPYPAFDLQSALGFVPLLTSEGCPFDCAYCASRLLHPGFRRRHPAAVAREVRFWATSRGVRDFVFYDDALLVDPEEHAVPLLERILRDVPPVRFHTPNAVHIRGITPHTAALMRRAGFHTVRLGLETLEAPARRHLDRKTSPAEFAQAAAYLREAGFSPREAGAYLLVGLPQQDLAAVAQAIQAVRASGLQPIPTYYSPIPGTRLWPQALAASRYDLAADPLFTNNAVLPCRREGFDWEVVRTLKRLCGPAPC